MSSSEYVTADLLEQVRAALKLSVVDFSRQLQLPESDYAAFVQSDNVDNFPPAARRNLEATLMSMERDNVEMFRGRLPVEGQGHFSGSKILHHLDKLATLKGSPSSATPITVEFHPTNHCNHRCPACTFGIPGRRDGFADARFDATLMPQLVDDLRALGVKAVDITGGGEPALHEGLSQFIRAFSAAGMDVGLVTNGWFLGRDNDRYAELREVILKHCTWCRISVDAGSQAVYERMHGKADHIDYDELTYGVKRLADAKREAGSATTIGVSFLLTQDNFLDLIKSACTFRDFARVDYFQVKPVVVRPVDRGANPNLIFWDRRLFDTLVALDAYRSRDFRIYTLGFKFIDLLLNEERGLPFDRCWGHPFYPTICADGSVLICCHMLNNLFDGRDYGVYGRVTKDTSLLDVWRTSERYEVGSTVATRLCPANCKLSETNKTLKQLFQVLSEHVNFIG